MKVKYSNQIYELVHYLALAMILSRSSETKRGAEAARPWADYFRERKRNQMRARLLFPFL